MRVFLQKAARRFATAAMARNVLIVAFVGWTGEPGEIAAAARGGGRRAEPGGGR